MSKFKIDPILFDYIIVGAGMAGCVMAERIANILDKKVLIIEKRDHIGGNCYDYYDENGILIHKYGPHIFHTNMENVWQYLSQFTRWNNYQHHVLGFIDSKYVPIPFNLNTLHELLPKTKAEKLEEKLVNNFGFNIKIPILELKKSQDKDIKFLADFIYEKVFLNYTIKQWGVRPEELDSSVTERVPIHISRDNRYFQDKYQGLPKNGYHKMFKNMVKNSNIKIMMNTNFNEVMKTSNNKLNFLEDEFKGKLIFTGQIDELFNYEFGELPYRSLKFKFITKCQEYFQEVGTVNYPNDYNFTRITEFKHLTGQEHQKTSIVREYSKSYIREKDIPYYPIPKKEYENLYTKYLENANKINNLILLGRLAEYKYYNMDLVIDNALEIFMEMFQNDRK
jgi:UDP-galactopyranose mutase